MCTTYLATEIIREFSELDIIGNPRLVRLNPNVPWKTRGNGAVSLRFGRGTGRPKIIGQIDGHDILCYEKGTGERPTREHFERACQLVERMAYFDDDKTNPGIILTARKPPPALYWKAVRHVVDRKRHLNAARPEFHRGWKNGRGLIGSISATAWRPWDRTYELITYRPENRWGKTRKIDAASVREMDSRIKTTFNNYDYEEKHMAIMPASPCPILYGIRGDVERDLHMAMRMVDSEKIDRWLIYITNQGTDDHIIRGSVSSLEPYTSVRIKGEVASMPRIIEGGHLIFTLSNGKKTVDCTIYEPAKGFRRTGEKLRPGDFITVFGGVREKPFTINVEKLHVEKLARITEKTANPMCKKCKKRMKSIGRGQGYRCAVCGARADEGQAEFSVVERGLETGWYEPPVGARRHLALPLKRQ